MLHYRIYGVSNLKHGVSPCGYQGTRLAHTAHLSIKPLKVKPVYGLGYANQINTMVG